MIPTTVFAAGSTSDIARPKESVSSGLVLNGTLNGVGGTALLVKPEVQVSDRGVATEGGISHRDAQTGNRVSPAQAPNGASKNTDSGTDQGGGDTGGAGDDEGESQVINHQVNTDTVWNNTNVEADNVNGDVNVGASATANAFQALTFNDTIVDNDQYASGAAVGSDLNAMTTNVNGSVNLSNTVACNSADVSTDPAYTVVNSKQECAVGDPSQATNVFAAQIQNDVNVSGAVAANVYTEDTNAKYNYVNTNQINESAVNSTTNVQTYNIGGSVNVSSSAVGNTAQIVHY